MSEKNNKQNTKQNKNKSTLIDFFKKKQVIAGIILIVILIICCVGFMSLNSNEDNSNDKPVAKATPTAAPTIEPSIQPTTEAAVTTSAAATETPTQTPVETATSTPQPDTPAPTPTPTPEEKSIRKKAEQAKEIITNNSAEIAANALKGKETALTNKDNFDSYIENQDYESAKKLLDEFFSSDEYSNLSLITYNNYVKYYESQGLYNDSALYQLNYIEQNDGLENVREESGHYKTLLQTLEKTSDFTDSRLDTINTYVAAWKEMTDAILSDNYDFVINKTTEDIKSGNETLTDYIYLTQALHYKGEPLEQAKVYYCYLSKDVDNMNQLEQSYYTIFKNSYNMLYYRGSLTSDDMDYIETEFDYENYFK